MKLNKIESFIRYQEIVNSYGTKSCVTNDYIQKTAADLIIHDLLYEYCGNKNAFLLVKKNGFWRVYYYINDPAEKLIIDGEILTSEILFRSANGEPMEQVEYLESCGFKRHLIRDQYSAMYNDLKNAFPNNDIIVRPAQTTLGVQHAFELFNLSFDKFTGDYISPESYDALYETGNVLLAWKKHGNEADFLGAIHQTIDNNVAWISHIAVMESARRKHVGQALLDAFVEKNMVNEKTRYMLWVQHQNETAINMYMNKGFKYNGKSSFSMIKLNE